MNSLQLAQRLARLLTQPDLATLPMQASLDVLDAINAGMQEVWRLLPATYRTQTFSATLKAPESIPVTVTARYGTTVTTNAFDASMVGCTVRVNDAVQDNRITGLNSFLDPFLGQSLTGNAQVFHDALQIFDNIQRIVGDMRIYRQDGTWYPLQRAEGYRRGGIRYAWWEAYPIPFPTGFNQLKPIHRPMIYMLESEGITGLTASEFFLSFYPMPDVDYIVRYEAEVGPLALNLGNITSPTLAVDMPVKTSMTNSALVPICEEYLLRSPFIANRKDLSTTIQAAAARARETLHNRAGDAALPNNDIGVPPGY